VQVSYAQVMQAVWHDSAVLVGARFLPTVRRLLCSKGRREVLIADSSAP